MVRGRRQSQAGMAGAMSSSGTVRPALRMSASATRRKSYKKAQGEAVPFSPARWDKADGGQLHAGKLQVMEKFFTPLHHPKEGKGSGRELSRRRQQWLEGRIDSFSSPSSSAASSTSAASWPSDASLEKEAFLEGGPMAQPQHSQSCVDISREARAFRRGRQGPGSYQAKEPVSFPRLKKGHSKSADRLPQQQGPREAQSPPPAQAGGESRLYKASSLERSLVFNEQAEILAPQLHKRAGAPAPSKGILKNGAVAKDDGLRKAKSIETIMVRAGEREPQALPPPRAEEEPELAGSALGITKKHHSMDQMKLVEEKLRFSEFLNEITRQVMSPSSLSSLGWRPPEASGAGKGSGTDSSESKSSDSKASSPGSLAESREGQHQQERAPPGKRRGPQGDHANPAPSRHMDDISSLELWAAPQTRPGGEEQRRRGEGRPGRGEETKGHEQPLAPRKVEKERASPPEEPWGKEQPDGITQKGGAHGKELQPQVADTELAKLHKDHGVEQTEGTSAGAKSGPAEQQDLHQTWEELELLKEKFSRLQEDYSNTQHTNQLLEEKLHLIAQSMAAERQTLNQRITELLERLISAQNSICTLERVNISALLSESAGKHRHMEKADSADSLYSLHLSDVAPPPAFMDSASDAHTTPPSQSDSATEANKPGYSSESDTATPNGDRPRAPNYRSLPPPGRLESHERTTAFMPWKQQQPGELLEHVNSTESECSAEEGAQIHALPMPRFLYLRQEALVAPSVPTLPPTDALRPPSPQGPLLGGRLELMPELSSTDSSDEDEAWSQGLAEKEPRVALDYQSAQKILDSLLRKHRFLEKEPGKASGGGYQDSSETGQVKGHQHQIRYYWNFQSPGEEQLLLHQPQHGGESLPWDKGKKVLEGEQECGDGVMDSTLL